MCISLVHHLHSETSTIKNICPCINHMTLIIQNTLVKIQSVEIKSHRRNPESSEPNSNNRPCSKKEMKRPRVIKRSILKNKASKITMSSNDVVCIFFLSELITIILRFSFSGLTNQLRCNQRTVHRREQ